MEIGPECRISFSARLDKSYPRGIHIGEGTAINFGACILTHDTPRGVHADTWIGKDCNIGADSLVAGNPARIMEKGIKTRRLGIIDRTVRPDFGASPSAPDEAAPEKEAS